MIGDLYLVPSILTIRNKRGGNFLKKIRGGLKVSQTDNYRDDPFVAPETWQRVAVRVIFYGFYTIISSWYHWSWDKTRAKHKAATKDNPCVSTFQHPNATLGVLTMTTLGKISCKI